MKYLLVLLFYISNMAILYAQQDPQLSQYMFNKLIYNPAYAGSEKNVSATTAFRTQWIGFDGQPITQTLSIHSRVNKLKGGIGLYLINDKLGVERTTSFMLSYAYRKRFSFGDIAFGLGGGIRQTMHDGTKYRAPEGDYEGAGINHNDNFIPDVRINDLIPDFSVGLYYHNDQIFGGISITHLLEPSSQLDFTSGIIGVQYLRNYYVTGGYQYDISSKISLMPSILLKSDEVKTQVDLNFNAIFNNNLIGGITYRGVNNPKYNNDALVILLGLYFNSQLYLGYSYDINLSSIGNYNSGSHELLLNYSFNLFSRSQPIKVIYSPRFL